MGQASVDSLVAEPSADSLSHMGLNAPLVKDFLVKRLTSFSIIHDVKDSVSSVKNKSEDASFRNRGRGPWYL